MEYQEYQEGNRSEKSENLPEWAEPRVREYKKEGESFSNQKKGL